MKDTDATQDRGIAANCVGRGESFCVCTAPCPSIQHQWTPWGEKRRFQMCEGEGSDPSPPVLGITCRHMLTIVGQSSGAWQARGGEEEWQALLGRVAVSRAPSLGPAP